MDDDDDTKVSSVDNRTLTLGKYLGLTWTGKLDILIETLDSSTLILDNIKSISDKTLRDILC